MMRRLNLLLLAALLGLSGSMLHMTAAKPVHADTACGWPTDVIDFPYKEDDGYRSAYTFVIGADGNPHQLNIDLRTWRVIHNGVCYRGAYVSTWFQNGEYGFHIPKVNVWTTWPNGQVRGPWTFQRDSVWDRGAAVWTRWRGGSPVDCLTCGQLGPWAGVTYAVTLDNGANVLMDFGNVIGISNLDRKANSTDTRVHDCNWDGTGRCNFFEISQWHATWWVEIWQ